MVVVRAMGVPTQVRRIPMSREQFLQLPEGPPFYDYVNGEAIEVNRPSVRHQYILHGGLPVQLIELCGCRDSRRSVKCVGEVQSGTA
jgi:hypothetical protein